MTREQAIQLVNIYDNQLPEEYLEEYLEYFQMSKDEFNQVIDKWANKDLFEKIDNKWIPSFEIV